MKNMLSLLVEISKAKGLLMVSSAPLIDRHLFTCRRKVWNTQGWSKGQRASYNTGVQVKSLH